MSGNNKGYETTDVHVGSINKFLVILFALVAVSIVIAWVTFVLFEKRDEMANPAPTPVQSGRVLPQGPKVLVNEPAALQQVREQAEKTLTSYGWEDKNAGVVRIPVSRAIDLVAEKGLPVFPEKETKETPSKK